MLRRIVSFRLLPCLVGLACPRNAAAQPSSVTVDFHPQQDWQTKGPIEANSEARVALTDDGHGLVWKRIELNVDEFPVLLIRVTNSLPRERWRLVVEQGAAPSLDERREIRLLERFAEEGGFTVLLQQATGWHGQVTFVVMVVLEGRKGDRVVLENLEAIRLTDAKPARPKLCNPGPGAVLSPPALHFCWYQASDGVAYELQTSKNPTFADAKSIAVTPPYPADKLPYLPEDAELLLPGEWFWRVRALNIAGQAGDWSEPGAFTIRAAAASPPRPPELTIAPDHPLCVLFGESSHLVENWKAVPEALKSYTVLRIEEVVAEQLQKVLQTAQTGGVPIVFQASGPHDYYGRTSSRIPLSQIEQVLTDYPIVKGVYICEQAFRVSPTNNRIMMDYAERLIRLCAAYGKLVLWADAHWGRNLWIDVGLNKKLVQTVQQYRAYFVPIWKMNGALTAYTAHAAAFGLWVGDSVDNWGVQPERWYWYEAGLGKLGEQHWFKEGGMADFPPTFYAQMILLGLSSGASVYALEPAEDIWGKEGGLSAISEQVTFPLLREIVDRRWIPTRAQVLHKIRSVCVADEADSRWALDYGTLGELYAGTYGVKHAFQMLPGTSRYYWIPILPKWTPPATLAAFPDQLHSATLPEAAALRAHLKERYADAGHGGAWVVQLDGGALIMNTRENWDEDQVFEVPLGAGRKLTGRIGVNTYVMARETRGVQHLQINGRAGRNLSLKIGPTAKPQQVVATPPGALANSSWDATSQSLVLEISLTGSAISVDIRF